MNTEDTCWKNRKLMKENKCSSCDLIQKYPGGMTKISKIGKFFSMSKRKH